MHICREPSALAYAIKRSCENKAEVVAQDEKESGLRATLNLGHTFAHVCIAINFCLDLYVQLIDTGIDKSGVKTSKHLITTASIRILATLCYCIAPLIH